MQQHKDAGKQHIGDGVAVYFPRAAIVTNTDLILNHTFRFKYRKRICYTNTFFKSSLFV